MRFSSLSVPRIALLCGGVLLLSVSSSLAQTIGDGVDNLDLVFTTSAESGPTSENYPAGEWDYETAVNFDGVDAIESTLPRLHFSRLNTTVQGPAVLTFRWKIAGETGLFDALGVDWETGFDEIYSDTDWQEKTITLDCGETDVTWYFERTSTFEPGPTDPNPFEFSSAYLDQIVVTPIPNSPDVQAAVENLSYEFYTLDWTSETKSGAVNDTVAKSGPAEYGETSSMMFEVEGPVKIEFDWGIVSEPTGNSYVRMLVDGTQQDRASINHDLTTRTHEFGPGTHCVKFEFYRDFPFDTEYMGLSEAYVDNLSITPIAASPGLAIAVDRAGDVFSSSWTAQGVVSQDGVDAACVSTANINESQKMFIDLPDEAGLLRFWIKSDTDAGSGYVYARVDGKNIEESILTGDVDWTKVEMNLPAYEGRVMEGVFVRFSDVDAGSEFTAGYLDQVEFLVGETNFQPDLTIRAKKGKTKGLNIFNTSGAGQKAVSKVTARRPIQLYTLSGFNTSSSDVDNVILRGTKTNKHFKTFFLVNDGSSRLNYTSAFVTGRFSTVDLDSAEGEAFELYIRRKPRSTRRTRTVVTVGTSASDTRKLDVVKATLKVKK